MEGGRGQGWGFKGEGISRKKEENIYSLLGIGRGSGVGRSQGREGRGVWRRIEILGERLKRRGERRESR